MIIACIKQVSSSVYTLKHAQSWLLFIFLSALPLQSLGQSQEFFQTSFNCSGVIEGSVEHTICTDKFLAKMDRLINEFYQVVRSESYSNYYKKYAWQEQGIDITNIDNDQKQWRLESASAL